jgi:hypothetical protein
MEEIREISKVIAITAGLFMLSVAAFSIVIASTILLR